MLKMLIIIAHLLMGAYGVIHTGIGDLITLSSATPDVYHIGPIRALVNVPLFIFFYPRVQRRLFGGCVFTKLQAMVEKKTGKKETERFLPDFIPTWTLEFVVGLAIVRSAMSASSYLYLWFWS